MAYENSLKSLTAEFPGVAFAYVRSLTSSVTTSWGVDWNEEFIARDIMQNFFDANRGRLPEVKVGVEGTKVTITAPADFNLERLFYLGSEKGAGDIGQYGEGFKAAAVCLLRDFGIEPIVISGDSAIYLRVGLEKVPGTELQPVIYDFFHAPQLARGTKLILRGCSKDLVHALQGGMTHFFFTQNPLLGAKLWSSHDEAFSIYRATSNGGHIFYRSLKRGEIPEIPVVLVIDKKYETIEKKTRHDRDRNAFGDELMTACYKIFARSAVKDNPMGQRVVVETAKPCWTRGHPLLSEVADASYRNIWSRLQAEAVFGTEYYARCTAQEPALVIEYTRLEQAWREQGRQPLPAYFATFGVLNARDQTEETRRKAFEEAKRRHNRPPTPAESKAIRLLSDAVRNLAPATMAVFDRKMTTYSVAETEVILGELKQKRTYSSQEVFFSNSVFMTDLGHALATFLHEHTHIFGYDGSRGFSDALTELIETVVRNRKDLDAFEDAWDQIRAMVRLERQTPDQHAPVLENLLASMNEEQLRGLLNRLPPVTLRRALESEADRLTECQHE